VKDALVSVETLCLVQLLKMPSSMLAFSQDEVQLLAAVRLKCRHVDKLLLDGCRSRKWPTVVLPQTKDRF